MDRRLFVTAGSLALLFGVAGVSTVARADPPAWAPAHGWRRKNGTESDYTGKKNKNRSSSSDDLTDREAALARRERALARQQQLDRESSLTARDRLATRDRIDRENRLLERERALRER